jgi:putative transposase
VLKCGLFRVSAILTAEEIAALDHWACWNRVDLDLSRPGKPFDRAYIEPFNGNLRWECLSQRWCVDLPGAQRAWDAWREDYNNTRPLRASGGVPAAL